MATHDGNVAGMIAHAIFLFKTCLMRLINDNQAQIGKGKEKRRARAHQHLCAAIGDGTPDTAALGGSQIAVPNRWLDAKAGFEAGKEWGGQRDFGKKHQNLFAQP